MYLNGRFGEINGVAIPSNKDLLASDGLIGAQTVETTRPKLSKLGIQAATGTKFNINGIPCVMGKTGIFELDNVVTITSLIFPEGAANTTIIDYIY